ncbi:protein disulfide-isomerase-like [Ipomoea triloba]|uniref:protein disulfide-isomerase-like n=1 Tax=Ipomoea triloba TaxID=35885 RepID=UPI00125D139B|nr:protein disulfide-isomerase-like [Ipomoea triloba]
MLVVAITVPVTTNNIEHAWSWITEAFEKTNNHNFLLLQPQFYQYVKVHGDQAPLVLGQTNDGEKYLKPNVEPDQIATWVKDFKDGKLKPFLSSEPIPENNRLLSLIALRKWYLTRERMDATANDIPKGKFEVKGFPTLYFKSAFGNLLQYEGNRTKEDIIDFICFFFYHAN